MAFLADSVEMKPIFFRLNLCLLLTISPGIAQTIFTEGLQYPQRLIFTPAGNLLVSEGGIAVPNNGRISLVDSQGKRRSLLEGLPAAPGQGIPAFGPTGMALDGRTLYLLVGEGDVMVGPPFSVNLDGPASPIFSSVLRIQFSRVVDTIDSSFQMTFGDQWSLSDGSDVTLQNAAGDQATIHLLTSYRSPVRNILGGAARARPADPYGVWLDAPDNALYLTDASSETLVKVNTVTGHSQVLTRFQPEQRVTAAGTQFVDNVPTALCRVGDSFLVSFLSAGPFPAGAASVRLWNPSDGAWSKVRAVVSDLTMASDLLCLRGGSETAPKVVTVEYTTTPPANFTTGAGRVQLTDGTQKRVLAQGLLLPTAIAQSPTSGELYVLTVPGTIFRLPAP